LRLCCFVEQALSPAKFSAAQIRLHELVPGVANGLLASFVERGRGSTTTGAAAATATAATHATTAAAGGLAGP
jgi:hypothetical protein